MAAAPVATTTTTALVVGLLICALDSVAAADKKPNFVILFGDDWGYGDLGANWKDAEGMTPNLDKIAAEGLRFTDFHVGASVCSVSRAALLTGRLGVRNGVVHNFGDDSLYGLPRTENTIAELLKPAGYRTAVIGKWHLGTTPGYHPTYRGFDMYLGLPYSVDMGCTDDMYHDHPPRYPCNKHKGGMPNKQYLLPMPLYSSTSSNCSGKGDSAGTCNGDILQQPTNFSTLSPKYEAFAHDFIMNATKDPSPFFLYVPFSHVHTPQYTTPANVNVSGRNFFYDSLMELDQTVGVIMSALKASGTDDNTLVFVTGDNGPWEVKCELTGSVGPYLGSWQKTMGGGGSSAKTTLWEAGHRVVGLARWTGKITPRVSNATLSSMDYLPTMLAIAGVTLPSDRKYDGMDISHVLFDGSNQGHDTLFHPNSGASGPDGKLDAVRWKNYKAIYQTGGAPECGGNKGNVTRHDPPLLFDLSADPAEANALDTSKEPYKTVVMQIAKILHDQMVSVNTTMHSIVNYDTDVSKEPCCDAPKTCHCNPMPIPPPPPKPSPPPPPPSPVPGEWAGPCKKTCCFVKNIGWINKMGDTNSGHAATNWGKTQDDCCAYCAKQSDCAIIQYRPGFCWVKSTTDAAGGWFYKTDGTLSCVPKGMKPPEPTPQPENNTLAMSL